MLRLVVVATLVLCFAPSAHAQQSQSARRPSPQALDDCRGKAAGVRVMHSTPEGVVAATCVDTAEGLVARPDGRPPAGQADRRWEGGGVQEAVGQRKGYTLEQAVSDRAQLTTIAFNGLAFITGNFGASSFIPPGKVADFFGFQFMRDIDAAGQGHSPQFLDRVAGNVLSILDASQLEMLRREAPSEADRMRQLALRRLPMIAAFHDQLGGRLPAGSVGLNKDAVRRYAGAMFAEDAALAYQRAAVFGRLAASLAPHQQAALGRMRFGDFNSWPAVDMERHKLSRGTEHLTNVAYMTLASEFFSWYAGSSEADTYFCPERHGTYFGGFYLKDAPAMAAAASGRRDYQISTSLTGESGEAFMGLLAPPQRRLLTDIIDRQRGALADIVEVRRAISLELRKFLGGAAADREKVIALGRRYGELDGELAWLYATTFAKVAVTLTAEQRAALQRLRGSDAGLAAPAYLYSDPLSQVPIGGEGSALFFSPAG